MKTYVYNFEDALKEIEVEKYEEKEIKNLFGNKAYHLSKMMKMGIQIPPGFLITTEACRYYLKNKKLPDELDGQIKESLEKIESSLGLKFNSLENPLFLSVRSGSAISMPGMLETVLNLGMNDKSCQALALKTNDSYLAYDSYLRFLYMYGTIVLHIHSLDFKNIQKDFRLKNNIREDSPLEVEAYKELIEIYKKHIEKKTKEAFNQDSFFHLKKSIIAVFESWNLDRAVLYRKMHGILNFLGTAVSIQAMVFGNKGDKSGTGVLFTRDPNDGRKKFYGEFMQKVQGEALVSGERTPENLDFMKEKFPKIYQELIDIGRLLENSYKDMQDIEFTIENNKLWILQCRSGKRTAYASFNIALDFLQENLITVKEAILRIDPTQLNHLLKPIFNLDHKKKAVEEKRLLGKGLNAGPGNVYGRVVFESKEVIDFTKKNEPVILVRNETSPEDVEGMFFSEGILTNKGGSTSHAALVARQFGKVAVVGFGNFNINFEKQEMLIGNKIIKKGDYISLDGNTGEVFEGIIENWPSEILKVLIYKTLKAEESRIFERFSYLMEKASKYKDIQVLANADQPNQIKEALAFGAEGVGLCRTEHMFFKENRLVLMQELILTDHPDTRKEVLNTLRQFQEEDFYQIFDSMQDYPVKIRLMDPPFHEFLPKSDSEWEIISKKMNINKKKLKEEVLKHNETNPMLGNRGCRLAILNPDITEMQVRAIFSSALKFFLEYKKIPKIEIMIPFVSDVNELRVQKKHILNVYNSFISEINTNFPKVFPFRIGVMIEIPRAAILAEELASEVDFFSFGTNDLTQTTFAISRDDSNTFMPYYLENNIFSFDPFEKIDEKGVGFLIQFAIEKARKKNPNIQFSICGEHAAQPKSIEYFHSLKYINSISCSPYQIPVAILSVAQNALKKMKS